MPFPNTVNYNWPAGFPGRLASANPMRTVVPGQNGFRAAFGGLIIARFAWIDADGTTLINGATETGSGATATAVLTSTSVTSVTVTNGGANYDDAPTVVFSGGSGSGAAATAVVVNGVVTAINVTAGGSGYTSAPTITLNPLTVSGAPSGFVYADQQGIATQYLQESTMTIPGGFPVGLAEGGDFFAVSATAATRGQEVYAATATGLISTAAAGSPPSGTIDTGWRVSQGGPAGSPIIITGPSEVWA